ncbi:MAG: DUF2225 domain-containing protein [Lachnospiraceae bacterium]|nr:DUF2225 domain-containing protein [Lachnospiraceae bacterium]
MNLFSGLEKFGFGSEESMRLYEEEQKNAKSREAEKNKEEEQEEAALILQKTTCCKVCEHTFKTKAVKSGRARRLQPDRDLRPRFQYIDTLKYDVVSCPACGYTALSRDFDKITPTQAKMVREQISAKFHKSEEPERAVNSYNEAIDLYKLALLNTVAKRGKESEKAFICLKLAWVMRGKADTMAESTPEEKEAKKKCMEEEEVFYMQAYDGFCKAISQEMFPICGMDESTMDYLLAYMGYHFKKYEIASKFLANVLTSSSASRRLKDMALDLKEDIIAQLRK